VVIVRLGQGGWWMTRQLHLQAESIIVKPGDYVTAGQEIAKVGCTGQCTHPHTHFELHWLTVPFNPGTDSVNQGIKLDPLAFGVLPGVKSLYYKHLIGQWPLLKVGDKDPVHVPILAGLLFIGGWRHTARDGSTTYSRVMGRQVGRAQTDLGLKADRVVRPVTLDALYAKVAETR